MKIKFGAIVTDGRGKLGGHVASKNRSGSYLRTKVTPSNPNTARQSAVRSALALFSSQWSALTNAQRESWNGAVNAWSKTDIFGDIKNPTGKNLFTKLNINLSNAGFPTVQVAPDKTEILAEMATKVDVRITAGQVNFVNAQIIGTELAIISATPQLSAGTGFYKPHFRQIFVASDLVANRTAIYNAYVARFGVPVPGANISFELKFVAENGQTTIPQSYIADVSLA